MVYCVPMTQNDEWAENLASTVAEEVKRLRNAKTPKWSIRRLAEETEKIGYPIGASVLSNFEYGRRGSRLEVAELLVLAAALDVPPAQLLWPRYPDGLTEYLPDFNLLSHMAGMAFIGTLRIDIDPDAATVVAPHSNELVALVEERSNLTNALDGILKSNLPGGEVAKLLNQEVERITRRRNEINARIVELGGVVSGEG